MTFPTVPQTITPAQADVLGIPTALYEKIVRRVSIQPGPPIKVMDTSLSAHPMANDGPHKPNQHRLWLAQILLDSKLTDEEAYSIIHHHPAIYDIGKPST